MVPKKHEVAASQLVRQANQPWQRPRCLHHCETAIAPESVLALDHDRKIQALIQDFRKRPCRIERQRTQHRLDFAGEVRGQPFGLRLGPGIGGDEHHAVFRELRHESVVEQLILLVDQSSRARADGPQNFRHGKPVARGLGCAGFEQLFQSGHSDFEEFIQVGATDAQELDALEQRDADVLRLLEDSLVEFQKRQFAIDEQLRRQ